MAVAAEKIIFENWLSPGDIVVLTAAIRDLHATYPDRYITDVRTSCPALWENNPYITPIADDDPDARRVQTHYPLIHKSNEQPYHFIHGFHNYLSEQLEIDLRPLQFKGDIHLSQEEIECPSPLEEKLKNSNSYWIVVAGGKYDYTIKWWIKKRWQEVVNQLKDKILFVQVGEEGHCHPPLRNVADLRGKTDLRELIRLIYHSDGVLCPVTLAMHLSAAVPLKPEAKRLRPCVVINGGREPVHWEQYPGHQFLHTIGALDCCGMGGCWRSRTSPLGDGTPLDKAATLCLKVSDSGAPKCMEMITAEYVSRAVAMSLAQAEIN
jgi:ADP-heptose:LPS heptosyltransferase